MKSDTSRHTFTHSQAYMHTLTDTYSHTQRDQDAHIHRHMLSHTHTHLHTYVQMNKCMHAFSLTHTQKHRCQKIMTWQHKNMWFQFSPTNVTDTWSTYVDIGGVISSNSLLNIRTHISTLILGASLQALCILKGWTSNTASPHERTTKMLANNCFVKDRFLLP